ncbi:flippase-like domain-containing protein, partial [Candidatus Micrarchaeota archaeon]|nr:flippase-like domain-containing protein [Candidatus Micrarchaeota archaeon]MBU1940112.1 flippase-like domain-containing protein [Candidatus Micrarchaeota archaeon]
TVIETLQPLASPEGLLLCIVAFILYSLSFLFRGIRWKELLKPITEVSVIESTQIILLSFLANNILPLRLGELVRAYVLGKNRGIGKVKSFSTVVLDRIVDGLVLVGIFAVSVLFVENIPADVSQLILLPLALFIFVILVFAFPERLLPPVKALAIKLPFVKEGHLGIIDDSLAGSASLRQGWGSKGILVITSLAEWSAIAAMYWVITAQLGIPLSIAQLFLLTSFTSLGAMLPSAPGYIGTHEAMIAFVLVIFGFTAEQGVSVAILSHIIIYLVPLTLAPFCLSSLKTSWREIAGLG